MNTPLPEPTRPEAAAAAVAELHVDGMTCNNCARKVTTAVQTLPEVHSVAVSVERKRASVRWKSEANPNLAAALAAIKAAGFDATPIAPTVGAETSNSQGNWHLNLWIGGAVTATLMLGEWAFHLGRERWFQWLAFALASVVQVFCGAQFYRGAWRQLKVGSSNMDTLVALGSTTAFAYSAFALFSGLRGHLYFMEAASIITLISIGHWIEARVSERASGALKSLLQLAPQTARRLGAPASGPAQSKPNFNLLSARFTATATPTPPVETEVPVADLRSGDHVALRPGDRVPVDGVVTEGASAVDESMLTGESKPVDKSLSAELYAGTVNLNGRLVMRVTKTGEATALASIIAAVQRAQTSRANIQRLGDRVSNVFVPVVVVIAIAAGMFWGFAQPMAATVYATLSQYLWTAHPPGGMAAGFIIAAAVLIIACPCAMGLATPAAIMASANAAAKRGILIRDGVALEKAGQITAIVLDKTGTLTSGELGIAGPWTPQDSPTTIHEVQELASALAKPSNHPVSKVIAPLGGRPIELKNWKELPGAGVEALLKRQDGSTRLVRLGSWRWLEASGVQMPGAEALLEEWKRNGSSLVGLAEGEQLTGVFAVRDFLKANSAKVIQQLQDQGLKTYLATGDNSQTAAAIASQVGIAATHVFAEVKPEQKAEFIKKLQALGERVAFVGDGINDAPALTQADLGIAVSRASDVAREAADIILLKSEIEAVPEALGLARATLRTIKQNLFWAFFYNALGIPLAALGFMSPVLCAAAMGFSDLIVIGNALRLRRWKLSA